MPGTDFAASLSKVKVVATPSSRFRKAMTASGEFAARRREQQVKWMWSMLESRLMARLRSEASIRSKVKKIEAEVAEGRITPALAAEQIVEWLR